MRSEVDIYIHTCIYKSMNLHAPECKKRKIPIHTQKHTHTLATTKLFSILAYNDKKICLNKNMHIDVDKC